MFKQTFILVLLFDIAAAAPVRSQAEDPVQELLLADFDARDFAMAAAPEGKQQIDARHLLELRRAGSESFLASAKDTMPGVRMELNRHGVPKMFIGEGKSLSAPSKLPPEENAKNFLRDNAAIFQFTPSEVENLRLVGKESTRNATFLAFNQTIHGIDVFDGHIKFLLNNLGEVVEVGTGDVAPGISLSTTPGMTPEEAVKAAFKSLNSEPPAELKRTNAENGKISFSNPRGGLSSPITAELSIFPVTAASARLAYRIFLELGPQRWFEMLIDAENGNLLYRHNLYVPVSQGRVWTEFPRLGESRELLPFPSEWLPTNGALTTGNNVDAYLDTDGNDQPDPVSSGSMMNGRAYSASSIFDFLSGDGLTGQNPRDYPAAAVTNLFYFVNVAHDYFYDLGFTESLWNYQTDNLGRGGQGNDAVLAQSQMGDATNNAYFAPTPEGTAARMAMGLFTRGTSTDYDDLDASYDGNVVIHEYGHGVSTRLVGLGSTTSCLHQIHSGSMGEGWSDYFSISYFDNPVTGAYITQNFAKGVRRMSYEGYTYTYEDMGNSGRYEVHSDGEIWAATLWDLRKSLGATLADQLVFDGLKLTPCNPTMTAARDAILSADQAGNGGANRAAIWEVFARHGLGYSAAGTEGNIFTGARYDAALDMPPDLQTLKNPAITSNPISQTASVGIPYSYQIVATNPNAGVLNYELTQGPAGMTVNPTTGLVSWPSPSFTGERVKITVTDGLGGRVVHGFLLAVVTRLNDSVPLTISGRAGIQGNALIVVPSNVPIFQITMRNGTGSAGLYTFSPTGSLYASVRTGTTQTITLVNPRSGQWQISIVGSTNYSNVALQASCVTPTLVNPPAGLPGLSGVVGSEMLYRIPISSGASQLKITSNGKTGDMDIFLRRNQPAACQPSSYVITPCYYDYYSANDGSTEHIDLPSPGEGTWYLSLSGYTAYSGVRVEIDNGAGWESSTQLSISSGGAADASTVQSGDQAEVGYATLTVNSGVVPYGTAVFSFRQNGVTVTEAGVPASPPTTSARIFIDYRASVNALPARDEAGTIDINTGLAIVNHGAFTANVTYTLRDLDGKLLATGHGTIAAGGHIACFIDQLQAAAASDFILPPDFRNSIQFGSLEIAGSQPLSVLALRGTYNQRNDFLITTTPTADLTNPLTNSSLYFPQFVDGGGYTTSLILMNTSGSSETGTFQIMDGNGSPLTVTQAGGEAHSSFSYSIPPGGSYHFQTEGSPADPNTGWVRLTPDPGTQTPVGSGVFGYNPVDVLVSESGIPSAAATTHARVYVDLSGGHNTGLAIANVSGGAANIAIHAYQNDGATTAGTSQGSLQLPVDGYRAAFADEFITGLPEGFTGVLDISSTASFAALTLRTLVNEAGDFLMTTIPVADATRTAPSPILFPQVASGGGYITEFILIGPAGAASTTLSYYDEDGNPWSVGQ